MEFMTTDDFIIAQFKQVSDSINTLGCELRETNKAIGRIEGTQKSHWGIIKDLKDRVESVVVHYQRCPAMEELASIKTEVEVLKSTTASVEDVTEIRMKLKTPSKPPPKLTPDSTPMVNWRRDVFNGTNIRLFLLILLLLAAGVAAVAGASSIPLNLVAP
jgi:hypothetical protein